MKLIKLITISFVTGAFLSVAAAGLINKEWPYNYFISIISFSLGMWCSTFIKKYKKEE